MKSRRPQPEAAGADSAADFASPRTPLDWPRQTGRLERVMAAIAVRKERRRRRVRALGAVAAALLVTGAVWFAPSTGYYRTPGPKAAGVAVLSLPEKRILPDGSLVELKAGSEIAVDFGGEFRRVALRRGEAHFQVRKNPDRAFVVEAGGMEFRAVGTAFAVQLSGARVEMLVTEGRVAVERVPVAEVKSPADRPRPPAPLAMVDAGNSVSVRLALVATIVRPEVVPVTPAESGEKLAWRVPRMELNDTPLAEAIATINRHEVIPVVIGDRELGSVGVSGTLRADNVELLLRMLESNYGVQVDRRDPEKIVLRKGR